MKPLVPAVVYGLLFAIWASSIYFLCDMAMSIFQGGDITKIYTDTLAVFLVVSVFGSLFIYDITNMIEERNRIGREELEKRRQEEEKRNHPPQ